MDWAERLAEWMLANDGENAREVWDGCDDDEIRECIIESAWASPSDTVENVASYVLDNPGDKELAGIYGLACVHE